MRYKVILVTPAKYVFIDLPRKTFKFPKFRCRTPCIMEIQNIKCCVRSKNKQIVRKILQMNKTNDASLHAGILDHFLTTRSMTLREILLCWAACRMLGYLLPLYHTGVPIALITAFFVTTLAFRFITDTADFERL